MRWRSLVAVSPLVVFLSLLGGAILVIFRPPHTTLALDGAPAETTSVSLVQTVETDFVPIEGYFFVRFANGTRRRLKASIVSGGTAGAEAKPAYHLGVAVVVGEDGAVTDYSVLAKGGRGKGVLVPPKRWSPGKREDFLTSTDALRLHLSARKELLKALEDERRSLDENLQRLRSDVDVISDIGRIVQAREELQRKEQELQARREDIEVLQRFFSSGGVGRARVPKNASQREIDLTQQLAALTEASKRAEVVGARAKGANEMERKLSLLDMAKNVDPVPLERQLQRLREKRIRFEEQLIAFGIMKPTPTPTMSPSPAVAE